MKKEKETITARSVTPEQKEAGANAKRIKELLGMSRTERRRRNIRIPRLQLRAMLAREEGIANGEEAHKEAKAS